MRAIIKMDRLGRYRDFGVLCLRLLVGFHLIYGTQDNVFNWQRMLEFRDFLAHHGFPLPLLAAHISVYAQFIAGLLFITGAWIRPAALLMTVNFLIALAMVHLGDTYPNSFPALTMLACAVFFLLNGAGGLSLDERWNTT